MACTNEQDFTDLIKHCNKEAHEENDEGKKELSRMSLTTKKVNMVL